MGFLSHFASSEPIGLFRNISRPVFGVNVLTNTLYGVVADSQAVGTHVGDQTHGAVPADIDPFIKLLGNFHGLFARPAKPDGRLLLQGTGFEGGVRSIKTIFLLNRSNRPLRGCQRLEDQFSLLLVRNFSRLALPFREERIKGGLGQFVLRPGFDDFIVVRRLHLFGVRLLL